MPSKVTLGTNPPQTHGFVGSLSEIDTNQLFTNLEPA